MIYAPNALELTLDCDTDKFSKLQERAYEKANRNHRFYSEADSYVDCILAGNGMRIEYHESTYKKKVKLVVNPTLLLRGGDVKKLWEPDDDNVQKLLYKLEKYIEHYLGSKYKLNNFKLTRIHFAVNIDLGNRKLVTAYIKVMQNIGKVKGFAPKHSKEGSLGNLSFDLEGNSNGIEFTAYDKESGSGGKKARGVLCAEVRLVKQKTIRKCTNKTITSKQLEDLALNSKEIFLTTFAHVVPFGDYYKKKDAMRIVEESGLKRKSKAKMLRLLELIPKKKSLLLAQKAMNERNIEKIMKMFEKIHLSPVTISKRQDIKYLDTLYLHMLHK